MYILYFIRTPAEHMKGLRHTQVSGPVKPHFSPSAEDIDTCRLRRTALASAYVHPFYMTTVLDSSSNYIWIVLKLLETRSWSVGLAADSAALELVPAA